MDQTTAETSSLNPADRSGRKVRRAIFPVLDRSFQVKVTLFILLLILLSHLVLLALHYRNLTRTTAGTVGMTPVEMKLYLQKQQTNWTRDLVLGVVAIGTMVGMVVFYLTQRVSGPLYAMSKVLDEAAKGNLKARVNLRKHDELVWFADKVNETLAALEARDKKG